MDTSFLLLAFGLVLFAGLSLLALTLYRALHRFLTQPVPPPIEPRPQVRPRDSLTTDPKLMAFFKRVDPTFHAPASLIVPTPITPIATGPASDPDLAAVIQIWSKLSLRDRQELRRLAEIKRDNQ